MQKKKKSCLLEKKVSKNVQNYTTYFSINPHLLVIKYSEASQTLITCKDTFYEFSHRNFITSPKVLHMYERERQRKKSLSKKIQLYPYTFSTVFEMNISQNMNVCNNLNGRMFEVCHSTDIRLFDR